MKSSPYADIDGDFWQPPRDPREFIAEQLARLGISLDDPRPMSGVPDIDEAQLIGPPLPPWWHWRGEFVTFPGQTVPVSRDLCKLMHWKIPGAGAGPEVPALPEAISDDEAELRSIEEMVRR